MAVYDPQVSGRLPLPRPDPVAAQAPGQAANPGLFGGIGQGIGNFLSGPAALPFAAGLLGGGSTSKALGRGFGFAHQAMQREGKMAGGLQWLQNSGNGDLIPLYKSNPNAAMQIASARAQSKVTGPMDLLKESVSTSRAYRSDPIVQTFTAGEKNYNTIRIGYERAQGGDQTPVTVAAPDTGEKVSTTNQGAADMTMIFGFMKMLDDGVVREGEYANAASTAGLMGQLMNTYENLKNGAFLTKDQRREFFTIASKIMQHNAEQLNKVNQKYSDMMSPAGIDPGNVLYQPGTYGPPPPNTEQYFD